MKLLSATEGEGLTVVPADFRTAEVRLQFYHEKLVLYSGDNEILGHWGALPHIAVSSTAVVGLRGGYMSYAYKVNEDVLYRAQGTQGRAVADPPISTPSFNVYPLRPTDVLDTASRANQGMLSE